MRLVCRQVAVSGMIALLGASAVAVASPLTSAAAAPASAPAGAPSAGSPVAPHKTSRLCGAVVDAGHVRCFAIRQTDTVQPAGVRADAVSSNAVPSGYGPQDLAAAYHLDQTRGSGRTVSIVDAYDNPNAESDLALYRTQFSLPACTTANGCFTKVGQSGSLTDLPAYDAGWASEISLDLDMVSATCPKCKILLVEANTSSISDLGAAVTTAANTGGVVAISNSYGTSAGFEAADSDFGGYYNHPGIAVTASTGDSGYQGGSYPASSSYVTAVGGTRLVRAANTRGWTESAWTGAGSGCSSYNTALTAANPFSTGCSGRAIADVSAVADPQTPVTVYDGGWQVFGGTSVSSPIIAAVYALAGTPGSSDTPNAYPYARASLLNDVTSGSNGTCASARVCTAGTSWDGPTGLGTPNGSAAFTGANAVTVTNPGPQSGVQALAQGLQIQAGAELPGSQMTYSATGLPPGLALSPGTGLISGAPTAVGRFTVTVTASLIDDSSVSNWATFTWLVRAPGVLVSLPPVRVLDTRTGNGAVRAAVGPGADLVVQITGRGGVPAGGVSAVVVNVTVTGPSAPGWVSAWADGAVRPGVSNLNFVRSQTVPNLAVVPVGADGRIRLHNGSGGTVQLIADVSGYYLS